VPQSLLAKIARIGGNRLLNQAVDRIDAAAPKIKPSVTGRLAGSALLRIASRSVPGAIVVTGGLIAKTLHDRRKTKRLTSAPARPASLTDDAA